MVLPVKSRRCDVLATRGLLTMVIPPEQVGDVTDYDAMVLDSAVYTGHWLEPAKEARSPVGRCFCKQRGIMG